ncbi:GH25 family lysozyme [Catenulispora yoronensis]
MTVFFPDISSYEAGLTIQPGTVAVIAKATEGVYYRDAQYTNFKNQAARVGAIFCAYHFLKAGDGAAQAEYCHAMVGSTPVMLDVETEGTSKPTVADCLDFIVRMRSLGGRVWGCYFPAGTGSRSAGTSRSSAWPSSPPATPAATPTPTRTGTPTAGSLR